MVQQIDAIGKRFKLQPSLVVRQVVILHKGNQLKHFGGHCQKVLSAIAAGRYLMKGSLYAEKMRN